MTENKNHEPDRLEEERSAVDHALSEIQELYSDLSGLYLRRRRRTPPYSIDVMHGHQIVGSVHVCFGPYDTLRVTKEIPSFDVLPCESDPRWVRYSLFGREFWLRYDESE